MQSVVGNVVAFRVHAPCSGALLLDIFANAVTPQEYLTGEPMKFKSVCKFKIMCEDLHTVMVPLPGKNHLNCTTNGKSAVHILFYFYSLMLCIYVIASEIISHWLIALQTAPAASGVPRKRLASSVSFLCRTRTPSSSPGSSSTSTSK